MCNLSALLVSPVPTRQGRLCRTEAAQDSGKRFQKRADIYIENMPLYCSDINNASHRLNALNCMTEGIHDLKLQNELRLDMEKGFRDVRQKIIIICIYFCSTLSFLQPYSTRDTEYKCTPPTIGHIVRKSMIEKGHFSEYFFPLILKSRERLVKLFTYCLFSVPYYSSKALQRGYSACYKAHGIACVL